MDNLHDSTEPVAWMYPDDHERMTTSETFCAVYSVKVGSATRGESTVALYTTPPQRKPLSVEKILHLVDTHVGAPSMSYPLDNSDWINFARAIEAAHFIKE